MRSVIIFLIGIHILLFAQTNRSFAQGSSSLDAVQKLVDRMVRELSYSLNMNKQLSEENADLKREMDKLSLSITPSENRIQELEQSKFSLESKLKGYEARMLAGEARIKELEGQLKAFQEEKKGEDKQLENYKQGLLQAENKIKQLIAQRETEKAELFKSFYEVGTTYTASRKYKQAVSSFEQCLKINPEDANVHYNLGVLYEYEYGDRKGAIYHLKKYIELNPQAKDRKEIEFLLDLLNSAPERKLNLEQIGQAK